MCENKLAEIGLGLIIAGTGLGIFTLLASGLPEIIMKWVVLWDGLKDRKRGR